MTPLQELQAGVLAEVAACSEAAVHARRLKAIRDARAAAVPMRDIAAALGVARPTVYEWLKKDRKDSAA